MLDKIKETLKSIFRPEPQKSVVEVMDFHRERIEEDRYPESNKYFEAAKKLLEKYPAEEWEVGSTLFFDTKTLKHKSCPINFGVLLHHQDESVIYFQEEPCKMKINHGKALFRMFQPLFDKLNADHKKKQEEKQREFHEKLAAAIS